ncbi:MAG: transcriptional repressor NrdR [Planctomycetales bacterium]|nr:transcriptional repressor NrdR [Planctomycetales bacterium]
MKCPFCQQDNDRVLDSRTSQDGFAIRRRRECLSCQRRFTTYERLEELSIKVVKKDHIREPFSREKVRQGLAKACWKRPVSDDDIDSVVAAIESQVYGEYDNEIDSQSLGLIVMQHIKRLDEVAFVRFASVYREFKDARDFVVELQPMLNDTGDLRSDPAPPPTGPAKDS